MCDLGGRDVDARHAMAGPGERERDPPVAGTGTSRTAAPGGRSIARSTRARSASSIAAPGRARSGQRGPGGNRRTSRRARQRCPETTGDLLIGGRTALVRRGRRRRDGRADRRARGLSRRRGGGCAAGAAEASSARVPARARGVQRASFPPMELPSTTRRGARRATRCTPTRRCSASSPWRSAPPEPQLQHAALRLTARGWETLPLPAPDGSGAFVAALDLRAHEAVVEHSDGRARARRADARPRRSARSRATCSPRSRELAGAVAIDPTPQEVPWTVAARRGRRARDLRPRRRSRRYFAAATQAALVLAAFRAPYRGPLDAGQRLVGLVRPRREPLLRRARRPALGRLHHAQRDGRPGGRRRLVAGRRALRPGGVLRLRAPGARRASTPRRSSPPRPAGTRSSASTCSTGTTSREPPTRTRPRWPSRARRSGTPARSATGTRRCRRAPRATPPPVASVAARGGARP